MNDKYQDLYDQAIQQCIESGDRDPWVWERKFAELIIRECLKFCDGDTNCYISEHFGMGN